MKLTKKVRHILKVCLTVLLCMMVALAAIAIQDLTNSLSVDKIAAQLPPEKQLDSVTDENGNNLSDGLIHQMPERIAFRMATTLAASPSSTAAYDSVMLEATLEPETADDKTVDWSVAFVNPSSSWAQGKRATEYVTVTPTQDGATTATVTCIEDFGAQIKVVVKSRDNENAKAECTVDFVKRIQSVAFNMAGVAFTSAAPSVTIPIGIYDPVNYAKPVITYSDYTIDDTFTVLDGKGDARLSLSMSETELRDQMGVSYMLMVRYPPYFSAGTNTPSFFSYLYDPGDDSYATTEQCNKIAQWMLAKGNYCLFNLNWSAAGKYSSFDCKIPIYYTQEGLKTRVTGIKLNKGEFIV